jgi:hypothetical protein
MVSTAIVSVSPLEVKSFLSLNSYLHAKRLGSLSDTVLGALTSHSLQPSKIGDGLAEAKGLLPNANAGKQVDRLISNKGINDKLCQNNYIY